MMPLLALMSVVTMFATWRYLDYEFKSGNSLQSLTMNGALVGVAVPLFVVTMTSQNVPGVAVLRANGYDPPVSPIIATTGFDLSTGWGSPDAAALAASLHAAQSLRSARKDTEVIRVQLDPAELI